MKKLLLAALAVAGVMAVGASAASAHGCHRGPELGKHGWHRHAGPYCERLDVPPPGRHRYDAGPRHRHDGPPPPRCREECVGVGALRFCERKCH